MNEPPEGFGDDEISRALKQPLDYKKQIAQLTNERDDAQRLLSAHTKSQKCANCGQIKPTPYRRDDLGGYVCLTCVEKYLDKTLDERDGLAAKCAEMREALIPFQCETCNGTHVFTFECPSCLSGEGECACDKQTPEPCPQCQSDNGCKDVYAKLEHALSDQCGTFLLEKQKVLVEALERILNYPVHSEPVGGAYEMQDIASKALEAVR